jgi:histidinol dehydrogenase
MNIIRYPERKEWAAVLRRPLLDHSRLEEQVGKIIGDVAREGDDAVRTYTRQFDGVEINILEVTPEEIRSAAGRVSPPLKRAIEEARMNIHAFHTQQVPRSVSAETSPGVRCWQKPVPIGRVGLYIPGGSAPLFSTALMLGIPAMIAGCPEVILCSPPDRNGMIHPTILYIAGLLGIERVFRVGGVQAIAAMAHGTESIPAVDKIFGPGNQYVTMAKQMVGRNRVAIDMPAGPSELAVVADETSNPEFVASDLLSQAEHGPDSQVLLITDSDSMISRVRDELWSQLQMIPRKEIASAALKNSKLILVRDRREIIELINFYAPEHLIIVTEDYSQMAEQVVNAGSVFLGDYTPESAGDYASGTNHTLPTNGWAHAYSGVNMDSFYKKITFQEISRVGLQNIGDAVMAMAEAEALQAHSNAISIRLKPHGHEK